MSSNSDIYKIFNKIEGNDGCFNDVILFSKKQDCAKFNLVYFGGDIQVHKIIILIILPKYDFKFKYNLKIKRIIQKKWLKVLIVEILLNGI